MTQTKNLCTCGHDLKKHDENGECQEGLNEGDVCLCQKFTSQEVIKVKTKVGNVFPFGDVLVSDLTPQNHSQESPRACNVLANGVSVDNTTHPDKSEEKDSFLDKPETPHTFQTLTELKKKIDYVSVESHKIIKAVIFHIDNLIKLEEGYKLKHKKTLNRLKEIRKSLERIEDSIKFQTNLLLKMKEGVEVSMNPQQTKSPQLGEGEER